MVTIEDVARDLYERATAGARRHTAAAWIRWEDADPDCRAMWITFAERQAARW